MNAPHFTHDCERCRFLGSCECRGRPYDLYACRTGGITGPTVIARYGDEGADYSSGIEIAFAEGLDSPLAEAIRRCVALAAVPGLTP